MKCRVSRYALSALIVLLSLSAARAAIINETFTYPDGELRTVGSAAWTRSSGTSNDLLVSSGKVVINDTNFDDATTSFTGVNSGKIFASFTLTGDPADRTTSIVGSEYFASFVNSTSLRSRVFPAIPVGTAVGTYRLGVTNAANSNATILPTDLTLGTAYQVVIRFDFSTNQTTLWVNPTSESDPSISAIDAITPGTYSGFGLRQPAATSMGDYSFDNLIVDTTFAGVVPEPGCIMFGVLAMGAMLHHRRR